jgi:hypothetical protein
MSGTRRGNPWAAAEAKAARALAANKWRIESAASTGIASERTLSHRGYAVDPEGGGARAPVQREAAPRQKRKRRRSRGRRRRQSA